MGGSATAMDLLPNGSTREILTTGEGGVNPNGLVLSAMNSYGQICADESKPEQRYGSSLQASDMSTGKMKHSAPG